jgi:hypothetical protein
MFIRLAFFEGVMRLGRETDFDRPYCWRETPHALHVEIMREVEADDGAHRLPLVLQIAYPDRTALNEALASPIRARGREAKRGL